MRHMHFILKRALLKLASLKTKVPKHNCSGASSLRLNVINCLVRVSLGYFLYVLGVLYLFAFSILRIQASGPISLESGRNSEPGDAFGLSNGSIGVEKRKFPFL